MAITNPVDPLKAEVRISGTAPHQVLDFYIPKGGKGDKGDQGAPNTLTVFGTTTGPETPGATGPQGIQGLKGDPGGLVDGTWLGATDLNLLNTASGIWRNGGMADATLARNYPVANVYGTLIVNYLGSSQVRQEYTPMMSTDSGRVTYVRVYTGTWGPWRTYSSQRVDNTAGRAIYTWDDTANREQLTYGDTGWRELSGSLLNGWTGTNVQLRRVGPAVYLRIYNLVSTSATATAFYTIPTGFGKPSGTQFVGVAEGAGTTVNLEFASNEIKVPSLRIYWSSAFGSVPAYLTTDPWPTTLPGTAAGSIPNA